ncbi:protein disulfide-isomerase-like isoform X2 [Spinacia oleracea]|uniref:protein disulfide-isomerase n=1 Tax=Spinacia oleracea TaxID=3562 RepID=A0ABM3QHG6_SPIOL|nr:protein disulfide-isomerase-like isoform X2 [Spinacia oleracea]
MALTLRGLEVCLVVVLLSIFGGIQGEEESVITLDHSNFTDFVSKHDFIFVEFYAPGCGFCKTLAPEYEKAASILKKNDPPITLAKFDAFEAVNKPIARLYKVSGFPTLKILNNGGKNVQDEYNGPRKADDLVKYVQKQLGPASVEIKSTNDAASVIDLAKSFIVGVFPEFSGEEYENFTKLAEKLRNAYDFGHTLDAKILPRGDLSVKGPLIILFKPFDDLFADFKDFDITAMEKFIVKEDDPSVTVFNMDDPGNPYISRFFSDRNLNTKVTMILNFASDNAATLKSKFYDIAHILKGGKISFLLSDLEPNNERLLKFFKLDGSLVPLIYIQGNGGKKYLKANVEDDQVVPWFKKFMDGKIEEFIKSEHIPQENNEPVKVVVLKNLQDMVFNSGKEEFYAPWCGHCKKLAPILDEVALSYQNDPNVLIAKFDATANDVPSDKFGKVASYPTMYFISSNKEMIKYTEGRTKEEIINFIQKHRHDDEKEMDEPVSLTDEL